MKAVVLETRGREAAVLAMDGGVYIANGKYHVGETIDYREANGLFRTIDELTNVKGIGPAKLDKIRDLIIL